LGSNCFSEFSGRGVPVDRVNADWGCEVKGFQAFIISQALHDAVGVGDAQLGAVHIGIQNLGPEPAIGLKLPEVMEEAAQGGVGRGASPVDGGLSGWRVAVQGFGAGTALEAPYRAYDLDRQHFFDRSARAEFFPESLGEFGVFWSLFRLYAILDREEAELEVIARRSRFPVRGAGSRGGGGIEAIGLDLSGGCQG
jgi:hypothetical protein